MRRFLPLFALLMLPLSARAQTLVSMKVSPAPIFTAVGAGTTSFTCVSTFSDFSTAPCASPVWASGTPATATINSSTGVATPVAVGETLITATIGGVSGHVNLIVGSGVTHYVMLTGGDQSQCDGLSPVPLAGSSGGHCALNDIYLLLNTSTGAWNVPSGDNIQVLDQGPYYFGLGFKGLGTSYPFCAGQPRNCQLPPNQNFSRMLGNSPSDPTKIIMLNGLNQAFFLDSVIGVELGNFDISQPETCNINGGTFATITSTSKTGTTGTYAFDNGNPSALGFVPGERINVFNTTNGGGVFNVLNVQIATISGTQGSFGQFVNGTFTVTGLPSGTVASASESGFVDFAGQCSQGDNNFGRDGILMAFSTDNGPTNSYIHDMTIHGLADDGFKGSHYNRVDTDAMYFAHLTFFGNGEGGIDADNGTGGLTGQEGVGDRFWKDIIAKWNGCAEVEPNGGTLGGNGIDYCIDQAFNGNGDGIVGIATQGRDHYTHVDTELNAQDGLDLLHAGDDLSAHPSVDTFDIFSYGNEGQALKGGAGTVSFRNFIGIVNCATFVTDSYPLNPPGWNATVRLYCRASDGTAFAMADGSNLTLQNGTIINDQSTSIDVTPGGGGNCTTSTSCTATIQNVSVMGFNQPAPQSGLPGGLFVDPSFTNDPFANPSSSLTHNGFFQVKNGPPQNAHSTNEILTDPQFTAQAFINSMNVIPLSSSPLIGAGIVVTPPLPRDINNVLFSNPPVVGAAMPSVAPPSQLKGHLVIAGSAVIK